VRQDATAEQIGHLFEDVRTLVEKAGLAPVRTVEP
jgi:exo-beta-1,3-glucanase (GH17 family)